MGGCPCSRAQRSGPMRDPRQDAVDAALRDARRGGPLSDRPKATLSRTDETAFIRRGIGEPYWVFPRTQEPEVIAEVRRGR